MATLNKDGTPRKSGSGRKKGSVSFVNVKLSDLQGVAGANTPIPVSRVWLQQMGYELDGFKPSVEVTAAKAPVKQEEPEQKIEFKLS